MWRGRSGRASVCDPSIHRRIAHHLIGSRPRRACQRSFARIRAFPSMAKLLAACSIEHRRYRSYQLRRYWPLVSFASQGMRPIAAVVDGDGGAVDLAEAPFSLISRRG
jgi:hypothetical protein